MPRRDERQQNDGQHRRLLGWGVLCCLSEATWHKQHAPLPEGLPVPSLPRCRDEDMNTRKFACFAIGNSGFHTRRCPRPAGRPPRHWVLMDRGGGHGNGSPTHPSPAVCVTSLTFSSSDCLSFLVAKLQSEEKVYSSQEIICTNLH